MALWKEPEGGWADDGNSDIPIAHPIISLIPPIAATKELLAGEFKHSDMEKSTATLEVVILYRRETRALFEKGSNDPVCRSDDGKVPARNMPLWDLERVILDKKGEVSVPNFPGQCNNCPFSEWIDNSPPACGNSYVLLVDRGDGDLAQLRVKGTSIKPYRDFIAKKPHGKPTYFFRTTITAVPKEKGMNRWFEMRFKAEPLAEEDARRYDHLLRSQSHRFEAAPEEPDDLSAFMAEVGELMGQYFVNASHVSKFMKADFSEANIGQYMRENGYSEIEAFVAAVQRGTEPEPSLPFE
jgi:hypothetical protein